MRCHGWYRLLFAAVTASAVVAAGSLAVDAQMSHMSPGVQPKTDAPIHTTMKDLHAHGGVPPGWTFRLPAGDPGEGRKVFAAMECFACHEVKGETFPATSKTTRASGPDLTGMGAHHPAEYFAESIMNPNRVIVDGPGYTGPDGLSKMPSYADTMTIKQLADVVAYLKSLRTGDDMAHMHGSSEHAAGQSGSMHMNMK
jgi:mono/diheme cytochrome c family protein